MSRVRSRVAWMWAPTKHASSLFLLSLSASVSFSEAGQVKIISMGLPKTGTTATANALVHVGLKVAHNQGDMLDKNCDVIINTLESKYEKLDRQHPGAKWIITYSANASAWVDSVNGHVGRYRCTVKSVNTSETGNATRDALPGRRLNECANQLACHFYGCEMGLPPNVLSAAPIRIVSGTPLSILSADKPALLARYKQYYQRLFSHFLGRQYALVDVRAHKYTGLSYIHEDLKGPFHDANSAEHPGGWPKCH